MAFDNLLLERDGPVALLTINRPKVLNALNSQTLDELRHAVLELKADEQVRVVILTGAGEKAFCAGMDLAEMSEAKRGVPPPDLMPDLGRNITINKPTIAAVRGVAYAGGWRLAQM